MSPRLCSDDGAIGLVRHIGRALSPNCAVAHSELSRSIRAVKVNPGGFAARGYRNTRAILINQLSDGITENMNITGSFTKRCSCATE